MALEFFIACAPREHPVIPGAGGFRKARWALRDQEEAWRGSSDLFQHGRAGARLHGCYLCQVTTRYAVRG